MTYLESIRTALADLWDTGANAYELAQAVMKAADLESADIELEVESVIARALLAREFVDLAKVAAAVAKVLPPDVNWSPADAAQAAGRAKRRLQLKIGKTYKNREGDKVKIVSRQPHSVLPFRGSDDHAYREDGGFRSDGDESGFDLVEECEPDVPEQPKPEALPLCEAILAEIDDARRTGRRPRAWMRIDDAQAIIRKHFAALTVEGLADVMAQLNGTDRDVLMDEAKVILALLRKE